MKILDYFKDPKPYLINKYTCRTVMLFQEYTLQYLQGLSYLKEIYSDKSSKNIILHNTALDKEIIELSEMGEIYECKHPIYSQHNFWIHIRGPGDSEMYFDENVYTREVRVDDKGRIIEITS